MLIPASTAVLAKLSALLALSPRNNFIPLYPFALAFAGGTMLYVVGDEMIPETHHDGHSRGATYFMLIGFAVMIAFDMLIG